MQSGSSLLLQQGSACPGPFRTHAGKRNTREKRYGQRSDTAAFKNFGDGLLDYIEAGPKLRKWYGKGERPPDGGQDPDEEQENKNFPRDSVLVTDADSPTGELVLLQLIVARLKVTAMVKNVALAKQAYGDYVAPIAGSIDNVDVLRRASKTARAVICPGKIGSLSEVLSSARLSHVVLLSSVGSSAGGMFAQLLDREKAVLADSRREEAVRQSSVPLTIVRVGNIVDKPGGGSELSISQEDTTPEGDISREDVAQLLVRALGRQPRSQYTIAVKSQITGQQFQGWDSLFAGLKESPG